MNSFKTPLADAVQAYIDKGRVRGHMPGHKGSAEGYLSRFGCLAAWDLTETDGLDDLHEPVGAIAEAERLMAAAVGADEAFLLVNGATVGIQAAILAACRPGDTLLLPRNAHRSVWSAMAIGDVRPLWLPVPRANGLALAVTPQQLDNALTKNPQVKAVFLVNPSFYGVLPNLPELLAVAKRHGVITIVDEAHGAHFAFTAPELAAARLGADMVIDSWHKSMGSLGQTAVLLCNRRELAPQRWLTLLQTTSPSYPLLASLDMARAEWQQYGACRGERLRQNRAMAAGLLADCDCLHMVTAADLSADFAYDDTKLLLRSNRGHSGWQIAQALRMAGVEPEFADGGFALLLLTYADDAAMLAALPAAEAYLAQQTPNTVAAAPDLPLPKAVLTPFAAAHAAWQQVPLAAAVGRVSAGVLTPYPPGIAAVGPGEVITAEAAAMLAAFAGEVQGLGNGTVSVVADVL